MKEKKARCKMDICYVNVSKILLSTLLPSVQSSSRLLSDEPRTVVTVATSLFSASTICTFNAPITHTRSPFYINIFFNIFNNINNPLLKGYEAPYTLLYSTISCKKICNPPNA